MGKKGAAKAQKEMEKAKQKAKEKVVADKSFGLKNKKKSKAVQQYVATLNNSVGKGSQAEAKRRADKAAKEAKAQAKADFEALYKTVETKKDKERAAREAEVAELLSGTDPVVLARTLEDRVEECRRWVEKKTPITATIFRDWLARRKADKVAKQEAEKAERLKKGRLTGRELWPTIVGTVQDDGAAGDDEMARSRTSPTSKNSATTNSTVL